MTATYLINRFLSKDLNGKLPYEILFGTPPSYSNLKAFGSLCYAATLPINKSKLNPRSPNCVFLGYIFGKKYTNYVFYSLKRCSFLGMCFFVSTYSHYLPRNPFTFFLKTHQYLKQITLFLISLSIIRNFQTLELHLLLLPTYQLVHLHLLPPPLLLQFLLSLSFHYPTLSLPHYTYTFFYG